MNARALAMQCETLCGAWALIADPAHWTHSVMARDALGNKVPPSSNVAVSWCAYGALERAARDAQARIRAAAANELEAAAACLYAAGLSTVNDSLGHAAVERIYALSVALLVPLTEQAA